MRILQTEAIFTSLRAYEPTSLRAYEPGIIMSALRTHIHFSNWQRCWLFTLIFDSADSKYLPCFQNKRLLQTSFSTKIHKKPYK